MLCYDVRNCDCCGNICINHDDNLLQNENHIIKRSHLSRKIYKVWKCCCSNICSGQQFYCPQKPSQMNFFKLHHESKDPWKFLKLKKKIQMLQFVTFVTKTFPKIQVNMLFMFSHIRFNLYIYFTFFYLILLQFNSLIYIFLIYFYYQLYLSLSRIFSFCNRFGSSFSYDLNCSDPNINIAIELKEISSTMTCIEEAAIRQITPLISIVKLTYGNIGSKGNTTCMWNESKLSTILPNLPSKCQYFVFIFQIETKK